MRDSATIYYHCFSRHEIRIAKIMAT